MKAKRKVPLGLSRRKAIRLARDCGAIHRVVRRTGEETVIFKSGVRIKFSRRRKDAPLELVLALRREQALRGLANC